MRRAHYSMVALSFLLVACLDGGTSFHAPQSDGENCETFECIWQVQQGALERTGSWTKEELAFRMTGTPARISHRFDVATFPDCAAIELIANVAKDAQAEVELDYGDDGSVDARLPVTPIAWGHQWLSARAPAGMRHVRVSLDKQGAGDFTIQFVKLGSGIACDELPPLTLPDGSWCTLDAACTSGRCVLGKCSPCGAGGCVEGSACRDNGDCMSGGCAAGVCRACAANGSCGEGEGCSVATQCTSGACVFGSRPTLTQYPKLDGVCGACSADAQCASGHCVLGQCAACTSDSDCPSDQRCRYSDAFEATTRTCLPHFDGILPLGALCEVDAECADGARCAASPGRAKRCGTACGSDSECGLNEVCTGGEYLNPPPGGSSYEVLPAFKTDTRARVQVCRPLVTATSTKCTVHAQCATPAWASAITPNVNVACCSGYCTSAPIDPTTGMCQQAWNPFIEFLFY